MTMELKVKHNQVETTKGTESKIQPHTDHHGTGSKTQPHRDHHGTESKTQPQGELFIYIFIEGL